MAISTVLSSSGVKNISAALSVLKGAGIGLDNIHLAAIGGNIAQECGGNIWAYNDYACAGMCQWGGSRPFGCGVPAAPQPYKGAINTTAGMEHVNAIVSASAERQSEWLLSEMRNGTLGSFSLSRFESIRDFNQAVAYFCFHYEVAIDSISTNANLQILQARCIMGRRYFGSGITASTFSDYDFSNSYGNGENTASPPIILPKITYSKISSGDFNDSALDFDTITDESDDISEQQNDNSMKSIFSNTSSEKNTLKTISSVTSKSINNTKNKEISVLKNESKCTLAKEEAFSYTGVPDVKAKSEQITHQTSSGSNSDNDDTKDDVESAMDFDTIFENETNDDI